jgi:hypothetical protein
MRIKRFDMTPDVLKFFFSGERYDMQATENALPHDAELVRVHTNQNESSPSVISLFYTSAAYPDLPEGSLMASERILLRKYFNNHQGD